MIRRLVRLLGRRRATPKAAPAPAPAASVQRPPRRTVAGVEVVIWESELRAIAAETAAWTVETGGDLFGRWQEAPIVFLATKAGPAAERNNAHFRLDVDYLRKISEPFASNWNLRYFGDWHSHHRLGLEAPSSGDRRRIFQVAARNNFRSMLEIIVTTEGSQTEPIIRIHPWLYDASNANSEPTAVLMKVLAGVSPIRQALSARAEFPEQDLKSWERLPLLRIRIGDDQEAPPLNASPEIDPMTREQLLGHLGQALKQASGSETEQHATPFGYILVTKIAEPKYLALAVDAKWPLSILEAHRIDRSIGTTEPFATRDGLSAYDIPEILEVYRSEKASGEQR